MNSDSHVEGECPNLDCKGTLYYANIKDALMNYMCSVITTLGCEKGFGAIPAQCTICREDVESVFKLEFIEHRPDINQVQYQIKEDLNDLKELRGKQ